MNIYFNLALEEVLFNKKSDDFLLIWRGEKSVVIGKNQNPFQETNLDYLKSNNVDLARRISGGGAVFHDKGNINYTMIFSKKGGKFTEFSELMLPIVDFLEEKGIKTDIGVRNEMKVMGKKISGTAQYMKKNRILHHGTLLYDVNELLLDKVLKPKSIQIQSNSVKSVRSDVINLINIIPEKLSVTDFVFDLKTYLMKYYNGEKYILNSDDIDETKKLINNKYHTWEWIIGYTPDFRIKESLIIDSNEYYIDILIKNGIVDYIKINLDENILETKYLIGEKYSENLINNLSSTEVNKIMSKLV